MHAVRAPSSVAVLLEDVKRQPVSLEKRRAWIRGVLEAGVQEDALWVAAENGDIDTVTALLLAGASSAAILEAGLDLPEDVLDLLRLARTTSLRDEVERRRSQMLQRKWDEKAARLAGRGQPALPVYWPFADADVLVTTSCAR